MIATTSPPPPATRLDGVLRTAAFLLVLTVSAWFAWLSDDAFFSFRSLDNLVNGFGLTWNTDERVQAFTNPLWVLLMAGAYALTRELFLTPLLLSLIAAAGAVALIVFRLAPSGLIALSLAATLVLSEAVVDYATSGLENALAYLLIAAYCVVYLQARAGLPRLFWLGLLGALAAVNRLDHVLLVAPGILLAFWECRSWRALAVLALAGLPLIAWEMFAVIYYGFPFPNTYYAKLGTGLSDAARHLQGQLYFLDTLRHDPATGLILLLGLAVSLSRLRFLPLGLGLALYLLYVLRIGGDFMAGRFFSVPCILAVAVLAAASVQLRYSRALVLGLLLLCALLSGYSQMLLPRASLPPIREHGIADERYFYRAVNSLRSYRRGQTLPPHPWFGIGRRMQTLPAPRVGVTQVAGMPGFGAGPTVHVIDVFALADPLLARLPSTKLWRIGHFPRVLPVGYVASLQSNQNLLQDPGLAEMYAAIRLITRGPLFTTERWRAILRMNSGAYEAALQHPYRNQWISAAAVATPKADGHDYYSADVVQFTQDGLEVRFADLQRASRIAISLDNNDDYRLIFLRAGLPLATIEQPRVRFPDWGLNPYVLTVPAVAAEAGYDSIRISALDGDGLYGLGHLIPLAP